MTKEELLHKAIKIADKAHKGQKDKYHAPYIAHVMRVMEYGKTMDEKIVGVLHDVVEDNPQTFSLDYLRNEGFPEYILYAVSCLTKYDPDEVYDDFVKRTERSPLAVAVKLNDLRDNMDLRRVNRELTSKDIARFNKYLKAYRYLSEKY
ncbi:MULTISPECIES: phosphohydrolase [Chryseobacterium]|jgi:(p)ppGpp synthase/HD superfamily hydrolase|uniref:Phosphohydrolase n=2 Tax=Chryseobacterium aquaticum TaxID=452084 RepID=A0A0Q3HSS9_9FLAO|nr:MULTISPECIES: phosphohydrolase [Chryseobacterium]KNB60410.1 phosphohydrolase [Chryseobacterium sp. Hurlbut01]KQK25719.1 phosphohydrolase [Chryseobacterium aquaticum]KUJ56176.1 phosphohydrolase [Chryseobacterium aquaticum subsp. greenlandense]NMR32792.1 phosphohydrolase [Chryseobacterium aquaticum]NRQ45278.1 phosphohydrolase [Chryseobacterium sp. C-204]